jgi:hypothetical protein
MCANNLDDLRTTFPERDAGSLVSQDLYVSPAARDFCVLADIDSLSNTSDSGIVARRRT